MPVHTPLDNSLATVKAQTRAERRRLEKEKAKSEITYQLTIAQINQIRKDAYAEAEREYNKNRQAFIKATIECVIAASTIALNDLWGFGPKRLQDYEDKMENLLECVTTGTITFEELKETRNHLNEKAKYKLENKSK